MSDREASLQEVLVAAFQSQMNNIYTAIPCVVVAVRNNGTTAEVDIQPTINQRFKNGEIRERPVILGVPVSFPVSSSAGVLFPIKVGTTGTAIFSMRNLDVWKGGRGRPAAPANFAKYDKGDAIFYPGIQPGSVSLANPDKHIWSHNTDDVVVFNNIGTGTENEVRLKASGDVVINTNQDVFVNCENANVIAQSNISMTCANFNLDATSSITMTAPSATISIGNTSWTGNASYNGNYTFSGTQTFNGVVFSTHVHGASPPPSNP